MPSFGDTSRRHLATLDDDLQEILDEAIKHFDFSIIWGYRGRARQDRAYRQGNSQLKWPNSRHNSMPAEAVDIVPYPDGFNNDDAAFYKMATYILRAANDHSIGITWGGHWESLDDLSHFELKDEQ